MNEILVDVTKNFSFDVIKSKGILVGILTEINEDSVNMVSLDGFRLALAKENMTSAEENKFIISAKIMNEISKIVSDDDSDSDINIFLGSKKAVFNIGNTEVVLRLMEGEFIKYRDIIPTDGTIKVIVGKEILLESIERASLLAKEGKNNLIKMTIRNDLLTVTSRSEEGNVRENVYISKEGKELVIGFNSKYLLDSLKAIDDENIAMLFNTPISPCLIRPVEGNEYEYLVLPVRITNL